DIEIDTAQHKLTDEWKTRGPRNRPEWEAKPGGDRYYLSFLDLSKLCANPADLLCSVPMQRELMRTALAEFRNSIALFPTLSSSRWPKGMSTDAQVQATIAAHLAATVVGEMSRFVQELEFFDESRKTDELTGDEPFGRGEHAAYRLWQAR